MDVGAIVGGVASLAQLGMGIADRIKSGRTLKKAQSFFEQNKYEIPETAQAALESAERQASSLRLPGQDIMEQQVRTSTAGSVAAAREAGTSSSDILAMLAGTYGAEQERMQGIGLSAAQNYAANQQRLQGALNTMAGYEDQKWQMNVLYPYQQMLGQAEAYGTRGNQQISSGFGGLMSVIGGMEQVGRAQSSADEYRNRMLGNLGVSNPVAQLNPTFQNPTINAPRTSLLPFNPMTPMRPIGLNSNIDTRTLAR